MKTGIGISFLGTRPESSGLRDNSAGDNRFMYERVFGSNSGRSVGLLVQPTRSAARAATLSEVPSHHPPATCYSAFFATAAAGAARTNDAPTSTAASTSVAT